jgi:hypothetical protein
MVVCTVSGMAIATGSPRLKPALREPAYAPRVARGHVHLTHGNDVFVPLDFVTGCLQLSVPDFSFIARTLTYTVLRRMADLKPLTFGYKFALVAYFTSAVNLPRCTLRSLRQRRCDRCVR